MLMKNVYERPLLKPGTAIGVYEIRDCVSGGRGGLVYRAWNHHLGQLVLIREFFPEGLAARHADGVTVSAADPDDNRRFRAGLSAFLEQARVLADIFHPSVVRVQTGLAVNGTGYMVMDIEKGRRLSSLFKDSIRLDGAALSRITRDLLDGLATVHRNGLLHGGINPGSILIRPDDSPVLIEFTADRLAIAGFSGQLMESRFEAYMPPEQQDSVHCVSSNMDIYSLGATFYRCIANAEPVPPAARIAAATRGEPDAMQLAGRRGIPPEMAAHAGLLESMYRLDPGQRPAGAEEILEQIVAVETLEKNATGQAQKQRQKEHSRVRTGLWLTAVCATVVVVLGGFWFQGQRSGGMSEPVHSQVSAAGSEPTALKSSTQLNRAEPKMSVAEEPPVRMISDQAALETGGLPDSHELLAEPVTPRGASSEDSGSQPDATVAGKGLSSKATVDRRSVSAGDHSIADLLRAGERNLAEFNLTTPESSNAHKNYMRVLELDPQNQAAEEGVRRIMVRYGWLIDRAMRRGHLRTASLYLQRAASVAPDSGEYHDLRLKVQAGIPDRKHAR